MSTPSFAATGQAQASHPLDELLLRTRALLGIRGPSSASDEDAAPAEGESEAPDTLSRLVEIFGLSPFEQDLLLLATAAELDSSAADVFATLHGDSRRTYPTFQLALATLPGAHWHALLPAAALRRSRLLEVDGSELLLTAPLRVPEAVLHFLLGQPALDERLRGMLRRIEPPRVLPGGYRHIVEELVEVLAAQERNGFEPMCLLGDGGAGKRSVAALAASSHGLRLYEFRWPQQSLSAADTDDTRRLLERDAALVAFALYVDLEAIPTAEQALVAEWLADLACPVFLASPGQPLRVPVNVSVTLDRPSEEDQRSLWTYALGEAAARCNGHVKEAATRFSFEPETILRTGVRVRRELALHPESDPGNLLLEYCRAGRRSSLEGLAQRIESRASWSDIVLPESSLESLRSLAAQVRQQRRVLEEWGFAAQSARGLSVSALFHGPSGTGKTLAAEILARELGLELYRIDLSQMVSKYIGETEKNLRTLFAAAESSSVMLLFDEADALFGKRSEVRDSHDRYANLEVSYLLQRIEVWRGTAILTTNLRAAMDTAFLRRIGFFVSFPFPDQVQRRAIWERVFPAAMPSENLDFAKLSRLNLAGGSIRNIALHAAYIAADLNQPVRMEHLLAAARREAAKMDRQLSAAETGGWV